MNPNLEARGLRPHVLVVPGVVPSVHGLVSQAEAERLVPKFEKEFFMRARALPLHEPESNAMAIDPFGNTIALLTYEDGSMHAYGPFDRVEHAAAYLPKNVPADIALKAVHVRDVISSIGGPD
jgi:hypothetical protein